MIIIFKLIIILLVGAISYNLFLTVLSYKDGSEAKTKKRIALIKKSYSSGKIEQLVEDENKSIFSFIRVSESFRRRLMSAGIKLKPEEYLVSWFVATILPMLVYTSIYGFSFFSFLVMIVGFIIPPMLLKQAEKRRINQFNDQLNDALMIISNSLRSGFTFKHAIARVAEDMPPPISDEMRRLMREVNYGANMETALGELAVKMQSKELEMVNSAVAIQSKSGGNLAEIIEKVSHTISERIYMKRKIKALTAQGKMSGIVIGSIPVVLFIAIMLMNPVYMSFFISGIKGYMILGFCVIWEAIGMFIMMKMVDVEY